jgi:hypothetical protein
MRHVNGRSEVDIFGSDAVVDPLMASIATRMKGASMTPR